MKKLLLLILATSTLYAGPSSVFWTNCTTEVYKTGLGHLDENNYFTVLRKHGHNPFFAPDTGLEIGLFTWDTLTAEGGFDYYGGEDDPFYFNLGLAMPENTLFCQAPSVKIGFFNWGTNYLGKNRTNQNVIHGVLGKITPYGNFYCAVYTGNRCLGKNRQGFELGFEKYFRPGKSCEGVEYFKWKFSADYASGNNAIGGGGFAIGHYLTPYISILTGPVFFNSRKINGDWKWSVQLALTFDLF